MTPPEVILDRSIRNEPEFSSYSGKLDIERVESSTFRAFLSSFQSEMNEALRLENANASGGTEHPPFHFDYLDVGANVEIRNAHAFQREGFSFIVVTLPLVESIVDVSRRLSRSAVAVQLLRLDSEALELDILHGFFAQILLLFLISHEYTHHVHRHSLGRSQSGVWTEFPHRAGCGNMDFQAQELDADGYAVYLVLTHLLRGERRRSALIQLGRTNMHAADCDELLLSCFFFALLGFFCTFWHGNIIASIYQSTHPPPPVRIKYVIQVAEMWCRQFVFVPQSWFSPPRLQALFHTAAEAVGKAAGRNWDAEISFLSSAEGTWYDRQLLEKFEAMRRSERKISP
jgi:hypothetical protein